jgi:hypothetical protein
MHYSVHLGDSRTSIYSSILRHLIGSNSAFRVKTTPFPSGEKIQPVPCLASRDDAFCARI